MSGPWVRRIPKIGNHPDTPFLKLGGLRTLAAFLRDSFGVSGSLSTTLAVVIAACEVTLGACLLVRRIERRVPVLLASCSAAAALSTAALAVFAHHVPRCGCFGPVEDVSAGVRLVAAGSMLLVSGALLRERLGASSVGV